MNELDSQLFRTFFRFKKYLKTKKLEMFKVISKLENFGIFYQNMKKILGFVFNLTGAQWYQPTPNLAAEKVLTPKCAEFPPHLDTSVGLYT